MESFCLPPDFPRGPRLTTFPARVVAGSTVEESEFAAETPGARAFAAARARLRAPFGRPRFAVIPVAGSEVAGDFFLISRGFASAELLAEAFPAFPALPRAEERASEVSSSSSSDDEL